MGREVKGLPFGIQYYRAPTPLPEEWVVDLPRIKDLGFTFIQVRPQWRWHERREGEFCWDDLDTVFDLCAAHGLQVMFQFMLETAPAWLYRKYDCHRIDLFGHPILPRGHGAFFVGGWLPCFDHPMVRLEGERFIKAAVQRYRDRPNLLLWEAWNEPRSRPVGECCCPESLARYRQHLETRHVSIEAFNRFYGKAYGSFSEITPPPDFCEYTELALFRQWAMESVVSRVRWVYDTVRGVDDVHPISAHVGANTLGQDILADSSDDFATARAVDFYGTSQLFFTGDFIEFDNIEGEATFTGPRWRHDYYILSLGADWLRCVSPYFWINEIYTNSFFYTTPDISGDDLRFRIWTYLAGGAKGVVFWQYRSERVGNESGCSGLVGIDGENTARTEACSFEARRIREHEALLRDFQPDRAEVAILYDLESDLMSRIEDTTGQNFLGNTVKYTYKAALKGAYSLLWQTHAPLDFVSTRDLEKIDRYRLVYLPALLVVDGAVASILQDFVRQGGFLIAEEGLGLRDKRYWMTTAAPGGGLDRLFGANQGKTIRSPVPQALQLAGAELPVVGRRALLHPRGGRVLAEWPDGGAAAVAQDHSTGRTLLYGFHPGHCSAETRASSYLGLARSWLAEAGVQSGIQFPDGGEPMVQWRSGTSLGKRMVYLLNYEPHPVRISLRLAGGLEDVLSNTLAGESGTTVLPARDISILAGA